MRGLLSVPGAIRRPFSALSRRLGRQGQPGSCSRCLRGSAGFGALGFEGVAVARKRRQGYDPATLLKLYLYGYPIQFPSSRRLERKPT